MKTVSILDSFKFAFLMIKKNYPLLLLLLFINFSLSFSSVILNKIYLLIPAGTVLAILNFIKTFYLFLIIIPSSLIQILIIRIGLKGYDAENKTIPWKDIRFISVTSMLSYFIRYFAVIIIQVFLIMFGLLLFIIPGIIIAIIYGFMDLILIEHNLPFKKLFSTSENLTQGIRCKILGYGFIILFLMIPAYVLSIYSPDVFILWRSLISALLFSFIYPIQIFAKVYLYKDAQRQSDPIS